METGSYRASSPHLRNRIPIGRAEFCVSAGGLFTCFFGLLLSWTTFHIMDSKHLPVWGLKCGTCAAVSQERSNEEDLKSHECDVFW